MCQDDAVPVVIFDFREYFLAVGRGEIFITRIENLCHRVCFAECIGNFVNIGFQPDNERFLYQPETFHLVGRHTHNHRLSRSDAVPADAATVLLNHPDSVLLRGVEFIVRELFKGQAGECLRRAVIRGSHIAIKPLVVNPYQFVPYFHGPVIKPPVETLPNLLYLACGFLYGFFIRHTHRVSAKVNLFRDFGHGIM